MKKFTTLSLLTLFFTSTIISASAVGSAITEKPEPQNEVKKALEKSESTTVDTNQDKNELNVLPDSVATADSISTVNETKETTASEPEIDPLTAMAKANAKLVIDLDNAQKNAAATQALMQIKIDSLTNIITASEIALNDMDKIRKENESFRNTLASLDEIVWKQCLLFPLERRCDIVRLKKSTDAVENFAKVGTLSSDFKECQNVYGPMLRDFPTYNDELITCLTEIKRSVAAGGRKIPESKIDRYTEQLKSLKYFPYYEKRNIAPWQSIPYLDDSYTMIFELFKNGGTANDLQTIIDRLTPVD